MICYDRTIFGQDTSIENLRVQKNLNIEKITSKVAQMKSLMSLHPLTQTFFGYIYGTKLSSWNMMFT